ncbi:MAG: OmpA family protein [Actinomycetota bacterium]|nr:OmpA family protein [Actinomycetota bacterium]
MSVLKYLVDDVGIAPSRLSVAGYGEYKPILPNTTAANRAQNRRVDMVIMY